MSARVGAKAEAAQVSQPCSQALTSLQSKIDRAKKARVLVAQQIMQGEDWMLDYLSYFNSHLEVLEQKRALLQQAAELARS
ncbi:MAG: hypothetical protein P8X51_11870 [Maritimibacter sp.]